MTNEDKELRREQLENELDRLRDDVADLSGEITFSDLVQEVADATAGLPGLEQSLQRLRSRDELATAHLKVAAYSEHTLDLQRSCILREHERLQEEDAAQCCTLSGRSSGTPREVVESEARSRLGSRPRARSPETSHVSAARRRARGPQHLGVVRASAAC